MSEAIAFAKFHESLLLENNADIKDLKSQFQDLQSQFHKFGVQFEDFKDTLAAVLEVVTHINKRFQRQDEMEITMQDHDHRISALENHVRDRS